MDKESTRTFFYDHLPARFVEQMMGALEIRGLAITPITVAKGLCMPRTVEHYQANAIRDQDLILEQRNEIGRLKKKHNQQQQKINSLMQRLGYIA